MTTVRINLEIDSELKAAAENAAAAQHRTVVELIERLLTDYCRKRGVAGEPASSHSPGGASPKAVKAAKSTMAAELAGRTIDDIGDKSLPPEEQQQRKRRLIGGPKEFRDLRRR